MKKGKKKKKKKKNEQEKATEKLSSLVTLDKKWLFPLRNEKKNFFSRTKRNELQHPTGYKGLHKAMRRDEKR